MNKELEEAIELRNSLNALISKIELIEEERESDTSTNYVTRSTLSRAKLNQIKPYRNGWRVSIKNKDVYSKKNETLEEFTKRVVELGAILPS